MDKRYQVFISSTYQDLKNARQEVSQALLRADCFPAGMELFPAADEEQFDFIKKIIDQSDYYLLISAGRYGSIHPETGLSYTEMEYDYAVDSGKTIIRLIHKDPFNDLKGEFIEKNAKGRKALERFRQRISTGMLVRFWSSPAELGAEVVFSLQHAIKSKPTDGWVRSTLLPIEEVRKQLEVAAERIKFLEKQKIPDHRNASDFDEILKSIKSNYVGEHVAEVNALLESCLIFFEELPAGAFIEPNTIEYQIFVEFIKLQGYDKDLALVLTLALSETALLHWYPELGQIELNQEIINLAIARYRLSKLSHAKSKD